MAYPRIRQLGAGVAFQPATVLTASPGASPSKAGVLSQQSVFGARPAGADGLRQDRIYGYYRTAQSSPGTAPSTAAVVTLWAIANAQVDPGQPKEGKQNNPAATRNDAKKALSVLASQGWQNANSPNPTYPVKTMTTARPSLPTPVPVQPVKAPTSVSTPRAPSTPVVTTTRIATTLQPGQGDAFPPAYVNYLPTNFPGSEMLTSGMMDQSDMQSGTGAAAPTAAATVAADTGDGSATVTATARGPNWLLIGGGILGALVLGRILTHRR